MSTPRTACIIPVYNGERHLTAALDSALAQTRPFDEIIVVDDGSTDSTPAILEAYADRITCIRQVNQGVSVSRNRAISASDADLIAPLDGDDLFTPNKNEKQFAAFAEDPDLELCAAHSQAFKSPEMSDAQWEADPRNRAGHWDKPLAQQIITWMFRRELFERIGPFEGTRGEDTDWLIRARDADAKIRVLPDVLAHRRVHPASVTATWNNEAYRDLPDMFKRHLQRMRAKQKRD